ncbi:MAG: pitrilysin family protein [Pelovirga sp.]
MSEYLVDSLSNGVRLVTVPMPHQHSVELVCYVAVGGRCEALPEAGISHFLEHMLFRGTAEFRNSTELERAFEAIGGAVNASTDMETTCFHSRVHPACLARGIGLFASMLRRPRFNDIDTERRIILEEAREDFNEQGEQINPDNLMAELLWPGHPLGASLIGSPETLGRIGRAQLEGHYNDWYLPDNLVLCVCGPVCREEFRAAAEREFGDWQRRTVKPVVPARAMTQAGPQSRWVHDSDSQIGLQLAFRLPGRRDPRTLAVRLLRRILAWGAGARLPLRLREELGLTYAVDANSLLLDDCGYLAIDLLVAPANLHAAMTEMLKVLVELREQPLPADELAAAIRTYLFDLDFSLDQSDSLAVRYGWGLQVDYLRTLEQDRRELQQLTPQLLQQVIRELICSRTLNLVVVGPWAPADRDRVEQCLACSGLEIR